MKRTPQTEAVLYIRISSELRQRLLAQAEREARTISQVARMALGAGLAVRESSHDEGMMPDRPKISGEFANAATRNAVEAVLVGLAARGIKPTISSAELMKLMRG